MATRKLSVQITGDAKGGVNAMGQLSKAGAGMGSKMQGVGKKVGAAFKYIGVAAAAGAVVVGKFLFDAVGAARESAKISAETARVIQTTGAKSWGASADAVAAYSEKLAMLTGVDDEVIQSGANLLLTFTNVQNKVGKGNDVFNQAIGLANDMSVALGTDMKGASMQLGKALNDPTKGITALSRAGVSFTADQKEQIKTLQASGDVLGAQKIILGELKKEFGGAAAAAATPMDRLKVVIGNLQEKIGAALIPIIDKAAKFLSDNLPAALEFASKTFGRLQAKVLSFRPQMQRVVDALKSVAEAVVPVVAAVAKFIKQNPKPFFAGLAVVIGTALVGALWSAASAVLALMSPFILVVAAVALVAGAFVLAYQKVDWFRKGVDTVVAWFKTTAWPAIQNFAKLVALGFAELAGWVHEHWDEIKATVQAAITIVANIVRNVVGVIKVLWATFGNSIVAQARSTWTFIQKIVGAGMKIISGVVKTVSSLIRGDWSGAWNGIVQILRGAWSAIQGIISFGTSTVRNLMSAAWAAVRNVVSSAWSGIRSAVSSGIGSVVSLVGGLPGRIISAMGNVFSAMYDRGRQIIRGIIAGIKSMVGQVTSAIKSVIPSSIGGIDIPGFAKGGRPPVGTPYLVGENGPEIRIDGPGTIIPNHKISSGAPKGAPIGAPVTVNNFYIEGTVVTEGRLTDVLVKRINEAQSRSSRPLLPGVA